MDVDVNVDAYVWVGLWWSSLIIIMILIMIDICVYIESYNDINSDNINSITFAVGTM